MEARVDTTRSAFQTPEKVLQELSIAGEVDQESVLVHRKYESGCVHRRTDERSLNRRVREVLFSVFFVSLRPDATSFAGFPSTFNPFGCLSFGWAGNDAQR